MKTRDASGLNDLRLASGPARHSLAVHSPDCRRRIAARTGEGRGMNGSGIKAPSFLNDSFADAGEQFGLAAGGERRTLATLTKEQS